jgi:hypothetical protein
MGQRELGRFAGAGVIVTGGGTVLAGPGPPCISVADMVGIPCQHNIVEIGPAEVGGFSS